MATKKTDSSVHTARGNKAVRRDALQALRVSRAEPDPSSNPRGPLGAALLSMTRSPVGAATEELDVRIHELDRQLRDAKERLRQAREHEKQRSDPWPGDLRAEALIRTPPSRPAGDVNERLRRALADGWLVAKPSAETRDALAALDVEHLWLALHLDPTADPVSPAPGVERPTAELLTRLRTEISELERFAKGAAAAATTLRACNSTSLPPDVATSCDDVIKTIEAACRIAWVSRAMRARFLDDACTKQRRHETSRWRGARVSWLANALRTSSPRAWSDARVARLILEANRDFVFPPCPHLIEELEEHGGARQQSVEKTLSDRIGKIWLPAFRRSEASRQAQRGRSKR